MAKVVVIGAGPSGIIASLKAKEKGHEVILLERNDKCGKKLLLTGNGKCNYWNSAIGIDNYYTDNYELLNNLLKNKDKVINYLESLGITPKIIDNYYYPLSETAQSIKELLQLELIRKNIKVLYNTYVSNIEYKNNYFYIETNNELIKCDKVVLSTGSKAYPNTGSDGIGYILSSNLGHKINKVLPSLTSLYSRDINKSFSGIRVDAKLSLYVNDTFIKESIGNLQLTNYGLSGICTFNLSSIVSKSLDKKKNVLIKINFLPSIDNLFKFIEDRNKRLKDFTISEILESLLNYKLINIILDKAKIKKEDKWHNLSNYQKELLINYLSSYEVKIDKTNDFNNSQCCTGGISLNDVSNNLESKIIPNLYFTGEILDVDGICGGFNLAFAFISGFVVGSNL